MTGKVRLINHSAALLTGTLVSGLNAVGIEVVQVEPSIEKIRPEKTDTDIFVLFAGDYIYGASELLAYLKDICFGGGKILCAVGYTEELAEIEGTIPKSMIGRESVMSVMPLSPDGYLLKSMSREKILAAVDHFFEVKKWENPQE